MVLTLSRTPEGRPERRDGHGAITNGVRLVRPVTDAEARAMRVRAVRAQSGLWIFFSGTAAVSLLACAAAVRRTGNPTPREAGPGERSSSVK